MEKDGILLESGTNEFEIIEFSIGNVFYGINVAKVREIINPIAVTKLPDSHPYVEGIFTLRGKVIPLVSLERSLAVQAKTDNTYKVIVSEMNGVFMGFKVDDVTRIHRISWKQMEPSPQAAATSRVIGIVKMDNKLIVLLDFEKILSEIDPGINQKMTSIPKANPELAKIRKQRTVLIAEDSHLLRELLVSTLHTAGYGTIVTENGQEAWDKLEAFAAADKPVTQHLQLVITDIEMPQMDGHHLTKRIKADEKLQNLPVVIFSSLINEEMRRKGESLGADAQITKPEIEQLIDIIDKRIAV
jgi:two-component system chemotaxis response regulator CheV